MESTARPCGATNWPGSSPGAHVAQLGQALAAQVVYADAGADVGIVGVHVQVGGQLADVGEVAVDVQPAGAVHVDPLLDEGALGVKDLHAVVLAVGDVHPALRVGGDAVHQVELAGIGAVLAPGKEVLPSGEYLCTRALP